MSELPTFSVRDRFITHENPTLISDGLVVCQEAFIQIDNNRTHSIYNKTRILNLDCGQSG
jgi:hypothetical protein